jgi:hypothetical protein
LEQGCLTGRRIPVEHQFAGALEAPDDDSGAHTCKWLDQLCSNITRPALSDARVQLNAAGKVKLALKML